MQALSIKTSELGYPQGFIEHDMRTPEGLREVLREIEVILANAGIDLDPQLKIDGKTVKEQLAWLEADIKRLERDISAKKSELTLMVYDGATARKKGIVENSALHEKVKEDFKQEIQKVTQEAENFEKELEKFFAEGKE
jgi:hypothetical protein